MFGSRRHHDNNFRQYFDNKIIKKDIKTKLECIITNQKEKRNAEIFKAELKVLLHINKTLIEASDGRLGFEYIYFKYIFIFI